jgi:hypothetical protein
VISEIVANWTKICVGIAALMVTWRPVGSQPVEYGQDGSVIFNPVAMNLGEPVPFRFENAFMIAIKLADGTLDFYAMSDATISGLSGLKK